MDSTINAVKYFTALNLIKVDQCTDYPIIQLTHWLKNCKQIIYLNHFLSTFVVLQQNSSNNGIKIQIPYAFIQV